MSGASCFGLLVLPSTNYGMHCAHVGALGGCRRRGGGLAARSARLWGGGPVCGSVQRDGVGATYSRHMRGILRWQWQSSLLVPGNTAALPGCIVLCV